MKNLSQLKQLPLARLGVVAASSLGLVVAVILIRQGLDPRLRASANAVDTLITLNPAQPRVGEQFTAEIWVSNTHNKSVSAAELQINFPTSITRAVSFSPGTALTQVIRPASINSSPATLTVGSSCTAASCPTVSTATNIGRLTLLATSAGTGTISVGSNTKIAVTQDQSTTNWLGDQGSVTVSITQPSPTPLPLSSPTPSPVSTTSPSNLPKTKFLRFDGINDFLSRSNPAALNIGTKDFTLEAWFRTADPSNQTILVKGATSNTIPGYWLWYNQSERRLRLSISDGASRINARSNSNLNITNNTWHHVAVSVNRDGNATFYLNGNTVGTQSVSSLNGKSLSGSSAFQISHSNTQYSFSGDIDEVRVWDDIRSQSEIRNNKDRTVSGSSSNLIGYWRFDDSSGTSANDETANNNDLNISGAVWR